MRKIIITIFLILTFLYSQAMSETALDWFDKANVLYDAKEGKFTDLEKAMEYLNNAIKLKPNYVEAYYNRGLAYAALGQYQRAIYDFNKVILLKPKNADAYCNRGAAYNAIEKYQRAIEDSNMAIRLKPNYADAYNNRGFAFIRLGQQQRGTDDIDKATRLSTNDLGYTGQYFAHYYYNGRYQLAIEIGNELIQMQPDNGKNFYMRGLAYAALGQYQRAIADYNKAISLDPDDAYANNGRGMAYLKLGNKILGCRDAKKACELGSCLTLEWAKARDYCR